MAFKDLHEIGAMFAELSVGTSVELALAMRTTAQRDWAREYERRPHVRAKKRAYERERRQLQRQNPTFRAAEKQQRQQRELTDEQRERRRLYDSARTGSRSGKRRAA